MADSDKPRREMLIVDDEELIRGMLASLFVSFGWHVVLAVDAPEALKAIQDQDFDCLLTDKNLPGDMDGIDILRIMRTAQPTCVCFLVTGYPSQESAAEALALGAEGYIEKPFDTTEIVERVEKAVASRDDQNS